METAYWLFPPLLLLLQLLGNAAAVAHTQTQQGSITLGSSLSPTAAASWLSPSGRFAFGFYPVGDGGSFKIGVWLRSGTQRTVVWTADRDEPPVDDGTLRLTFDGRLLWSAPGGREKPISMAGVPCSSAEMLDSGNFVLYDSGGRIVWSTFDTPTDTILPGQALLPGQELLSKASEGDWSTGMFRLKMQSDGNLVLYPAETTDTAVDAYWDTGTFMVGFPLTLNLTSDGALYLSGNNSRFQKDLARANPPPSSGDGAGTASYYRATLDADGIFRLHSHRFVGNSSNGSSSSSSAHSVEWEALKDRCLVKGACGRNSYCQAAARDGGAICLCPPSFEFVDAVKPTLGCRRNSTEGGCRGGREAFTMATMENTFWADQPYAVLPSATAEGCKAACLRDCFCEAALFRGGSCTKQLLPLRYGRRNQNYTAFIKVAAGEHPAEGAGSPPERRSHKVRVDVLVICVALASSSVVIFVVSAILIHRHHRTGAGYAMPYGAGEYSSALDGNPVRAFSYRELDTSTGSFTVELGRGAFGRVFKGSLAGKPIAVKRLEKMVEEGEREFQREVRAIGRTHHRNLVRLVGFCNEGSNRILVYEYMGNGSLADLLFKPAGGEPRCWEERLGIALDVARGLQYLHEELETHIIHCDIKPQNILMDAAGTAKISDFGLAKLMMPDQTRTFTGIRGTRGYLAPEWHRNSPITVKTDVYSFGVVLLEIVCRRRSTELDDAGGDVTLAEYVYERLRAGEVGELVSGDDVDPAEMERAVRTGIWCVQSDPAARPSMRSVILMLEGNMQVPVPPPPLS